MFIKPLIMDAVTEFVVPAAVGILTPAVRKGAQKIAQSQTVKEAIKASAQKIEKKALQNEAMEKAFKESFEEGTQLSTQLRKVVRPIDAKKLNQRAKNTEKKLEARLVNTITGVAGGGLSLGAILNSKMKAKEQKEKELKHLDERVSRKIDEHEIIDLFHNTIHTLKNDLEVLQKSHISMHERVAKMQKETEMENSASSLIGKAYDFFS